MAKLDFSTVRELWPAIASLRSLTQLEVQAPWHLLTRKNPPLCARLEGCYPALASQQLDGFHTVQLPADAQLPQLAELLVESRRPTPRREHSGTFGVAALQLDAPLLALADLGCIDVRRLEGPERLGSPRRAR